MCYLQFNKLSCRRKFIVKNKGDLVHEFNIATKEMHFKHQPEMLKMMEHGILLGHKIDKV